MNTGTVLAALDIMWKGMAGIFVTILIIMVCVWVMENWAKNKRPVCLQRRGCCKITEFMMEQHPFFYNKCKGRLQKEYICFRYIQVYTCRQDKVNTGCTEAMETFRIIPFLV